jgi:PAS domain S-box-containing protein
LYFFLYFYLASLFNHIHLKEIFYLLFTLMLKIQNFNDGVFLDSIMDQTELVAKTGSWELDLNTKELFWSKGIYRILEIEPVSKNPNADIELEIIHPDDKEMLLQKKHEAINNGTAYSIKVRFITKNHRTKHIISSAKSIIDENNTPIKLIGIYQDVTELVELNEKIALLNKISNDVIYEWDLQNDVFSWGEGFEKKFGQCLPNSPNKISDWKKLIHPDDYQNQQNDWKKFIANPKAKEWIKKLRFKSNDNSYIYVEEKAVLIRDNNGKPIKMIGTLKDISTEKTVELQNNLQEKISLLSKVNKKTSVFLKEILDLLTNNENFISAEIWLTDPDKKSIDLKKWSCQNETISIYRSQTNENSKYKKGMGLPGIIWKSNKHNLWTKDEINNQENLTLNTNQTGVTSILGIPLFNKSNFIGTLLLYSKDDLNNYPYKINAYKNLCDFLGCEIERKKAEETYILMFESSPNILAIINSSGYFKKVNRSFSNLLGYSESELSNKPYTYFLHPNDLKQSISVYNDLFTKNRTANNFINRFKTKNGDYKWITWSSSKSFNNENNSFAYGMDITEMKELQTLFQETARLTEIGSWEYDVFAHKNPIFLSTVVKEILELESDTAVSLEFLLDFTNKEDRKKTKKSFQDLIYLNKNFDIEFRIITQKNNLKWIRCIGKVQNNDLNKKNKILGSIQNITKQKNIELELAKKNTYLSSITNITTELIQAINWRESLYASFLIIGDTIDVDRIYFFEMDKTPDNKEKTFSKKLEWTKNNIEPQINNPNLQNISVKETSELFEQLLEEKMISGKTRNLTTGFLKTFMESQNIKSFLIHPVFTNNELEGFIGFDDCNNERNWNENEISFLTNISYNLSSSLQRIKYNLELENSLNEKNTILESIDDAFISLDKNWIVNYWNKKAEEVIGIPREKIIGNFFWKTFPYLKGSIYENNIKAAFKNQKTINFQNFFEELKIWFDVSVYPSKNGLSIYFKDITQTKKHEYDLQSSNERFEKSTAATNEAIWDWDINNNSLYRSDGFYKLFGYELPNFIFGEDILELIKSRMKPNKADKLINSLTKTINNPNKTKWRKEYWYKKENGEYTYIVNNGIIIRDHEGKAIRIVGAIQDITYRKEQEKNLLLLNKKLEMQTKSLLKSNQELEHFAYVASHDLQEPLRMVTSFLTQLEKKYNDQLDEKGRQYINYAVEGAKRMRTIILDILEYSKLNQIEETYERVDLNMVLSDVCKNNIKKIKESQAIIKYNHLPTIQSSKFPLNQIFHNLIGNALKYQKPNNIPIIDIIITENKSNWQFKIKDNGIGIENEYLEKIFILFQRLHSKNEYSGNGIGLAVVKKLIENLNGKIWVESEVDNGTSFYFTLPKNETI